MKFKDNHFNKWTVSPLAEICEINPSSKEIKGTEDTTEVTFVPMSAVSEDGRLLVKESKKLADVKKGFTYFREGDILVAKITPCMENGKRWLAKSLVNEIGFGSTEFHVLRPKSQVTSEWIYYFISQQSFRDEAEKSMTGTAGQKRVPRQYLEKVSIPVPSIEFQKSVTSILRRIERLKVKREQANQMINHILQAVFFQFFGKSDFKKEPIGKHVLKTEIEDPRKKPEEYFKYIDISGINNKSGKIYDVKLILGKNAPSRARKKIRKNDVIISTVRPNLNATALVPDKLDNQICSTGFSILRCKPSLNPKYLYIITRRKEFINELSLQMKGASYPAVTNDDVLNIVIPIPPKNLQDKFESIVDRVELIKDKQYQSSRELNHLFESLISNAFKGS